MIHIFDTEIAKEYGVNAAILLQNISFWIQKNEANGINCYDGNVWTYNSRRAFKELFPYMSERQIYGSLQKLIDAGILVTGNYNAAAYDRTLWYALSQKGKCIVQNGTDHCINSYNGLSQTVQPIPNINTDINANINADKGVYQRIVDMYNEICISFPRLKALSEKRKKAIKARLKTYTEDQIAEVFRKAEASRFLKGGNGRNWSATFDWLMSDANFAKVLDGNYDDRQGMGLRSAQAPRSGGNVFLDMVQDDSVF